VKEQYYGSGENPRSVPITKREKDCYGGGERKKKHTNLNALLRWRRTQEEAYQLESIVAVAENARRGVPT
jgi:hypothetical protein